MAEDDEVLDELKEIRAELEDVKDQLEALVYAVADLRSAIDADQD